jgi:hypothetical protein
MQDYEKLGTFYLGRPWDPEGGKSEDGLVLYDSKDLVTHAVCFGMTGSGKTGLCIAMMEEAAIDEVPVLVIDPKGDISNLLLTFPDLSAEAFLLDRGRRPYQGRGARGMPVNRQNSGRRVSTPARRDAPPPAMQRTLLCTPRHRGLPVPF